MSETGLKDPKYRTIEDMVQEFEDYAEVYQGNTPEDRMVESYDKVIPAIANCILKWDFDTGEPLVGSLNNSVKSIRENKIDDEDINSKDISGVLNYLEDNGYVKKEDEMGKYGKWVFEDTNIYDLARLHRAFEQEIN